MKQVRIFLLPFSLRDRPQIDIDSGPFNFVLEGLEKGCFVSFFLFKLPLLSLRGSSGQVLALRVEKWSCRTYKRLSSAFFFVRAFIRNFQSPVVSNVVHSS